MHRLLLGLTGALALALLVPAAADSKTLTLRGTVPSGRHDGGAYRFTLDAPGWKATPRSGRAPYTFELRHGRSSVIFKALEPVAGVPLDVATAARRSARTQAMRAVIVDRRHAAVVDGPHGPVVEVYVQAGGPFPVVFFATTRPQARVATAMLAALAHGSRFDWAGPDVRHLPSDPAADPLIRDANAQSEAADAYRISLTGTLGSTTTIETVVSQRYRSLAYAPGPGVGARAGTDLFFGADSYSQAVGDDCWLHGTLPAKLDIYDPIRLPTPGPYVSYGPPQAQGANIDAHIEQWEQDATRTTYTAEFDASTHELRSLTGGEETARYDWHAVIAVPARPTPVCES